MANALLNIVLHQPEIPDNTGNIGRTCVALGAKLWLVRPLGFQLDNRHLRRAGLDYWEHLQWEAVDDWPALCRRLPDRPYWYFSKTAATCYTEVRFTPGDVLVFGEESRRPAANDARCGRRPQFADSDGVDRAELESLGQRGNRGVRGAATDTKFR